MLHQHQFIFGGGGVDVYFFLFFSQWGLSRLALSPTALYYKINVAVG